MHEASRGPCQVKKPFEGPRQRWGSCWEEQIRKVFPRWGVINLFICPPSKINDFFGPMSPLYLRNCLRPLSLRMLLGLCRTRSTAPAINICGPWGCRAFVPESLLLVGAVQSGQTDRSRWQAWPLTPFFSVCHLHSEESLFSNKHLWPLLLVFEMGRIPCCGRPESSSSSI